MPRLLSKIYDALDAHVDLRNDWPAIAAGVALFVGTIVIVTALSARAARADASLGCLPASIKAALARANNACGIHVISTLRPGARIAGTGHRSMHARCRAADFTSAKYGCVYRVLAGWPGQLSTDARRMRHVHIDDGRYARFVHGGHRRYARHIRRHRLARRHSPARHIGAPAGDRA